MRDLDTLLRELRGYDPSPVAPEPPRPWSRGTVAALTVALGAMLAAGVWTGRSETAPGRRGADGEAPLLELALTVERGGRAVRISPSEPPRVGERVFFRASSSRPAEVVLWVEGPHGQSELARPQVQPRPVDVGDQAGLVAWRFDLAGDYTFHLAPEAGADCPTCAAVAVAVR